MEMDAYHKELPEITELLAPLYRVIENARDRAYRDVRAGLRSDRFAALLTEWESYLTSETPVEQRTPKAEIPIRTTASSRILKAYRRMVKRGATLGDETPAEALHQLRIDAKKLRYLLEFFRSLYPDKDIDRLVRELKGLQDVLGGFNDKEVQQGRLVGFARQLSGTDEDHAPTLIAMGRLTAVIADRQKAYRRDFANRFEAFAHSKSQARYQRLFGDQV
jgi:CHAD domain-containing protein